MNKIFKVIWNEARNAYVVVSEIAKNHGSKSCSTKKLLAMLIATGVMTCASFDVLAAQPAAEETAAQQYVALKAKEFDKIPFPGTSDWKEYKAQKDGKKEIGGYTYKYDATNKYWVREGYVLTVDKNGGKYTQLSDNAIRADVAYTGTGVPEGILQSVTSTVARNGVVTHSGDSLQKVTAGSYAGVSHGGGTEVVGSWNYIINDASWEGSVGVGNYKDGYVDLIDNNMPRGFKTTDSGLNWDEVKQTYTYKGKAVDYRNMYVIDGKLGVFTNYGGSEVYTGTVYGKNNEILMTVKDNGKFYSYWAASVTDPSATMETYPVSKYNSDLAVIDKNITDLNKDIIKEVTLTKGDDYAIIRLVRNGGNAVDGAITVTSGGGTDGSGAAHDTFVTISNGKTEQTFATGSKVEAIGSKDATTGIKINGEDYTIKSGSKVSVTQTADEKTTTITVDGKATTITDTDTTYTKGDGIEISGANAISVSKNLTGMQSIKGAGGTINLAGSAITVNETTFNKDGRIQNVANGTETKDAVNFGQLQETNNKVDNLTTEVGKGWTVATENGTATKVGAGDTVKFSGDDNIKVSNTGKDVKVELKKNLTGLTSVTTNNAYVNNVDASKNESVTNVEYVKNQIADAALSAGNGISITDKKINVKLKDGEQNLVVNQDGLSLNTTLNGMQSITGAGEGAGSISFADGGIKLNNKVTINKDGKITGVAAGEVSSTSTDAVNGSQLHAVATEAGKHTTLSNGKNTTVESTVKDGQTDYKVNVAGDLTDITSVANGDSKINLNKDSIIISNGNKYFAITNSGIGMSYIGADYSAKSIMLGENGTTISGGLNVAGSKITGVAEGEADTDAVNVSQLQKVSDTANAGWNLATNGVATKATNVKPGDYVDFSGDDNIKVSHDGTNVKVELNDELKDIKSIIGAGEGAGSISFADGGIKLNNKVTINKDGKITGVAAGEVSSTSTDAVNGSQLHAVATEAGKHTTLSNGKNTTVESTVKDGQTDYKVNVAGDLTDITSVANGDSKINLNKDSIIISNGNKYFAITNSGIGMSYIGADYSAKSIMLGENGTTISGGLNVAGSKITGVAEGEVSSTSTDAVNGSQLHAVKTELQTSDKHLVGNPASADGYYKPDANGDISMRVEDQNKNGYDVVIKDVASKAELGDVANRVTNVENKVTQIETDVTTIKTDITTIKTDINNINTRVDNVEALAGKHTTLEKNGTNINVEETVVDGQKNYKVNLNKDITLGDENSNNVSISGTNGTITATGDITTANRINAANGGKLADIDVTGNKLSNGNSSITLDGTNVKVNDKVTVDKDGKISGVAKGDISNTSTDAVNGSQLYDTNTHITNVENQVISNSNRINQLGNRVNKVGAGAAALAALHPMDFDPDDKLTFSAGYGNYGGENAAAIGAYYRPDEKVMFSVAGTVGNGENMVNAGVSFALDRTNHVSNSRTALAREVIDLRGQLAVMGAKMAKMEKAFGMLDETKTKLFPDVPANHWAYEYIAKLAGNGYIEGYPDGNFGGDRLMTRYEFAAMLYRAIEKGAALEEKIIKEFEPELGRIRVDRISGEDGDRDKIERVRVNDTKGERDHYGNKLAK